jgi:hypothetical protein
MLSAIVMRIDDAESAIINLLNTVAMRIYYEHFLPPEQKNSIRKLYPIFSFLSIRYENLKQKILNNFKRNRNGKGGEIYDLVLPLLIVGAVACCRRL